MKICIIGLGRLGSAFATCWLKKGFEVVGVDKNETILDCFRAGKSPVPEPEMDEILRDHGHRLKVTNNIVEAVSDSDITFIIVSTPSQPNGSFSAKNVVEVCRSVGQALQTKPNHTVVIASTVSPGTINSVIRPTLDGYSNHTTYKLAYIPEWVALGELVHGFLNPDFTIIGCDSASDDLESLYRQFLDNNAPIKRMSVINAEISKVALNAYIATKITFANTIADYCERVPDADASVITSTIGQDSRIGTKYFKGGLSYGGPCFPRDIQAYKALGGLAEELAESVHTCNERRMDDLANFVIDMARFRTIGCIGLFGMAFKPHTNVQEASPSVWLLERLRKCVGCVQHHSYEANQPYTGRINLYDPIITEIGEHKVSNDLSEVINNSGLLVFMSPNSEFKTIDPESLKRKTVIDCWGVVPGNVASHFRKLGNGELRWYIA